MQKDSGVDTTLTSITDEKRRSTAYAALAWAAGLGMLAMVASVAHGFVFDDAYISLRYAIMLADTGELVWNPGERVEGITNFLYVLILAQILKFGVDPELAARGVSALGALMLLFGTRRTVAILLPGPAWRDARAMVPLLTLGTVALAQWVLGAMEAPLVAGFIAMAIWALLPIGTEDGASAGRLCLGGLFFGAAYLTRMDAALPLAVLLGGLVLFGDGRFLRRVSDAFAVSLLVAAIIAAHLYWRESYYGDFFPNTYYAKVGVPLDHRIEWGAGYLIQSLTEAPIFLLAVLLGTLALFSADGARRRWLLVFLLPVLAQMAYAVWSGGDHLPVGRFLIAAFAPAALVLAIGYSAMRGPMKTAVLVLAIVAGGWAAKTVPIPQHGGAEAGLIVGQYIATTIPEDQVIAVNTAGAIPYSATGHRFIDMLGLNDAHIARVENVPLLTAYQKRPGHGKGDGEYVLHRAPDVIIAGYADGLPIEESPFLGDMQLAASADFAACYVLKNESIQAPNNSWMQATGRGPTLVFRYYQRTC